MPIRQQQICGSIINNNVSLSFMVMIDPDTGCLKIVNIPTFNRDEVTFRNIEYINKSSARVNHILNNTLIRSFHENSCLTMYFSVKYTSLLC